MDITIQKNATESLSEEMLKSSQKHILTPVYKNKVRELINKAVHNGDDISLDEDGNILCLQTKFYVRKYEWDSTIQDFVKIRAQGRRHNLNEAKLSEENTEKECIEIKELVQEG